MPATATADYTMASLREVLSDFLIRDASNAVEKARGIRSLTVGPGRADEAAQVLADAGYHVLTASNYLVVVYTR